MDAFDLMSDYEDDQVTPKDPQSTLQTVEISKSTEHTVLEKITKKDLTSVEPNTLKRNFSSMTGDIDSKDN
jgi:hypothetical protein